MLLNAIEKAMMNNPVRAAVQRHFEASRLLRMGGPVPGGTVLEIGCGRGVGTAILFDRFGASRVDAFDLDPHMVALARRLLAQRNARVFVGDATSIDALDATYDAVFDFAIVHHVPRWRDALGEVRRVLKPGGRFYAEEVLARFIHHPLWSRVLDHPMEDRFDYDTFARGLAEAGLRVTASHEAFGQFAWFVAERPAARSPQQ
jgi:ubiquinone/menaquinone biosynthesis C-methylase UbiE